MQFFHLVYVPLPSFEWSHSSRTFQLGIHRSSQRNFQLRDRRLRFRDAVSLLKPDKAKLAETRGDVWKATNQMIETAQVEHWAACFRRFRMLQPGTTRKYVQEICTVVSRNVIGILFDTIHALPMNDTIAPTPILSITTVGVCTVLARFDSNSSTVKKIHYNREILICTGYSSKWRIGLLPLDLMGKDLAIQSQLMGYTRRDSIICSEWQVLIVCDHIQLCYHCTHFLYLLRQL